MTKICLYLHMHLPKEINGFNILDLGHHQNYFDDHKTRNKVLEKSEQIKIFNNELLKKLNNSFKISLGISGTSYELLKEYDAESLKSIQNLVKTGFVEVVGETYYNSLTSIHSKNEFLEQVKMHKELMKKELHYSPTTFKNTSLIYTKDMSLIVQEAGFDTILANGNNFNMNPNFFYRDDHNKILVKNHFLTDYLNNKIYEESNQGLLSPEDFLENIGEDQKIVNIFIDYSKIKNVHKITDFLIKFVDLALEKKYEFITPKEAKEEITEYFNGEFSGEVNNIQKSALDKLHSIETKIKNYACPVLLSTWRHLTSKEHIDLMNYEYLRSEKNPYDIYITFNNILKDLVMRTEVA